MTIHNNLIYKLNIFQRMYIYINEMFPPVKHFASSALMYISFISMLGIVTGYSIDILSRYTIAGIFNIFLIAFILRLMDELKDDEIDKELFPHRPLPSGRVKKKRYYYFSGSMH